MAGYNKSQLQRLFTVIMGLLLVFFISRSIGITYRGDIKVRSAPFYHTNHKKEQLQYRMLFSQIAFPLAWLNVLNTNKLITNKKNKRLHQLINSKIQLIIPNEDAVILDTLRNDTFTHPVIGFKLWNYAVLYEDSTVDAFSYKWR